MHYYVYAIEAEKGSFSCGGNTTEIHQTSCLRGSEQQIGHVTETRREGAKAIRAEELIIFADFRQLPRKKRGGRVTQTKMQERLLSLLVLWNALHGRANSLSGKRGAVEKKVYKEANNPTFLILINTQTTTTQ